MAVENDVNRAVDSERKRPVAFSLDDRDYELLEEAARKRRLPVSSLVRMIVAEAIDREFGDGV